MAEQPPIGRIGAVRPVDQRDHLMLEEVEEGGGPAAARDAGHASGGEIAGPKRHDIPDRKLPNVYHDYGRHPLRIEIILLQERHQREMPAVENIEHRIGFAGRGVVRWQGNEQVVFPADLRGGDWDLLGVLKADRRGGDGLGSPERGRSGS